MVKFWVKCMCFVPLLFSSVQSSTYSPIFHLTCSLTTRLRGIASYLFQISALLLHRVQYRQQIWRPVRNWTAPSSGSTNATLGPIYQRRATCCRLVAYSRGQLRHNFYFKKYRQKFLVHIGFPSIKNCRLILGTNNITFSYCTLHSVCICIIYCPPPYRARSRGLSPREATLAWCRSG